MKYKLLKVRGYWNDKLLKSKGYRKNYSEIEQDVNIALGYWEHIDTEDIEQDDEIFYYYDIEYEEKTNIEVGDIIADGFVITKIYGKDEQMETLSKCCKAIIRYLDCEDCRKKEKQCIYICSECGADA